MRARADWINAFVAFVVRAFELTLVRFALGGILLFLCLFSLLCGLDAICSYAVRYVGALLICAMGLWFVRLLVSDARRFLWSPMLRGIGKLRDSGQTLLSNKWGWLRVLAILALLVVAGSADIDHLFLRFVVCAIALHTAYKAKMQMEFGWVWIMATLAILFNPFFVLHFAAYTWVAVDWIAIAILGASLKQQIGSPDALRGKGVLLENKLSEVVPLQRPPSPLEKYRTEAVNPKSGL